MYFYLKKSLVISKLSNNIDFLLLKTKIQIKYKLVLPTWCYRLTIVKLANVKMIIILLINKSINNV
jgi:hypothetical protein